MKKRIFIFILALGPACLPKRPKAPLDLKDSRAGLCAEWRGLTKKDRQRRLSGAGEKSLLDYCLKGDSGYKQRKRDCKKIIWLMEAIKEEKTPFSRLIEDALDSDLRFAEYAELSALYIDKKCYEFE